MQGNAGFNAIYCRVCCGDFFRSFTERLIPPSCGFPETGCCGGFARNSDSREVCNGVFATNRRPVADFRRVHSRGGPLAGGGGDEGDSGNRIAASWGKPCPVSPRVGHGKGKGEAGESVRWKQRHHEREERGGVGVSSIGRERNGIHNVCITRPKACPTCGRHIPWGSLPRMVSKLASAASIFSILVS